ncbi:MAG: radical SAM protein, partial [Nitrospinota bacterium]
NVMKKSKVVCRHLHIPLQSGDNHILKKMRRNYLAEDFRALVEKLHREIKGIGVGTDVIVGFPGETDGAFKNTYSLIKELPLSYLHVFRYSKREGTEAAGFTGQMSNAQKKTRSKALIELGTVKKETFRKKHIRKTLRVLFEKRDGKSLGFMTGYTDNYIPVIVEGPKTLGNSIRDVMLVENGVEKVRGVLV